MENALYSTQMNKWLLTEYVICVDSPFALFGKKNLTQIKQHTQNEFNYEPINLYRLHAIFAILTTPYNKQLHSMNYGMAKKNKLHAVFIIYYLFLLFVMHINITLTDSFEIHADLISE